MTNRLIGQFVVVRCRSAGVHTGFLEEVSGTAVLLTEARRIWSWSGANTLNEVALRGVQAGSRISEPVDRILLTEAIEIIPATDTAKANLRQSRWC